LLAERRALSARGSVLLHADVRKCYASIAGVAVDRALQRLGADRDDRRAIGRQLGRFQDQGVPGLPIGPDPSAVLANAVLMDADLAFDEAGCPHLRWVDDVWAAAPNRDRAERALDLLRSALERIGLAVNEDKTCVVDAGAAGSILGGASGPRL
jgi:hypothetical protein